MSVLKSFTEVALLVSVILYVAGWSYLYGYHRRFGIGIKELDITTYDAMVFAIRVLEKEAASIASVLATWVFLLAMTARFRPRAKSFTLVCGALLCLAAGSLRLSRVGIELGSQEAHKEMYASTGTLPYVTFHVDPEKFPKHILDFAQGSAKPSFVRRGYKLLLHSKESYYLMKPITGPPAPQNVQYVDIVVLPAAAVQGMKIQANATSGESGVRD